MTRLTFRSVFRRAYRQAEGRLGSIIGLPDVGLHVPDHTLLIWYAMTLNVP